MNKTAEERFIEAGYTYQDNGMIVCENRNVKIFFVKESKMYWLSTSFNTVVSVELHKLIHYQLQELGWL